MKKAIILFFSVLIFGCAPKNKTSLNLALPMIDKYADLENYITKEIIAMGKLVEEKFDWRKIEKTRRRVL